MAPEAIRPGEDQEARGRPERAAEEPPAPPRAERLGGGLTVPVAVLLGMVVVSLAMFVLTKGMVERQERRLLEDRVAELSVVISSSIGYADSSLGVLAAVLRTPAGEISPAFTRGAGTLAGQSSTVVGARADGAGRPVVLAAVGADAPSILLGSPLEPARAEVFQRAVGRPGDLIPARIVDGNGDPWLELAVSFDGTVVFQRQRLAPLAEIEISRGSPFSGLRAAVYASTEPDADQVVLATQGSVPLRGDVERRPVNVGVERWLLEVRPDGSLVGAFAEWTPFILLIGGVVTALLASAVVLVQVRRRSYALALVASRTDELRRAREEAERANHSKSEFLSRMSHELRTPLNAVLGFGQLLEVGELTDDQREYVAHIRKGGKHLLELVNEVLDISRVESGRLSLSPEAVLVDDVVGDALELIRPLADQRSIQLVVERDSCRMTHVFADRQRTKQILLNLLSNAVKYNRHRGTVVLSCDTSDLGRARIRVADTGPGIAPEQVSRAFEPFERLGAEQTAVEGTGIGLALSKRLAEAMGGSIGVDSVPGRGSTFWLDLPAVEDPVGRYERLNGGTVEERPVPPPADRGRQVVLHIEDNLSNATLVERILEQRPDVEVVAAMQGHLGVDLAREHRPVLVLLDLHLPDMDGEQVLNRLRADPRTASIPVVIVSADATTGQVQRLLSAGAADYLTKPIDVQELLRVVDQATVRR